MYTIKVGNPELAGGPKLCVTKNFLFATGLWLLQLTLKQDVMRMTMTCIEARCPGQTCCVLR